MLICNRYYNIYVCACENCRFIVYDSFIQLAIMFRKSFWTFVFTSSDKERENRSIARQAKKKKTLTFIHSFAYPGKIQFSNFYLNSVTWSSVMTSAILNTENVSNGNSVWKYWSDNQLGKHVFAGVTIVFIWYNE